MGLLVIRKNLKKDALDVTQKGPINIKIAKKHAVRAKNVFLGVDTNPTLTYIYNMKERNKLMKKLTKKQKLYNHLLSKKRIIVENIIKRCKIFRITKDVYRGKHKNHGKVWNLVAGLVNFRYGEVVI